MLSLLPPHFSALVYVLISIALAVGGMRFFGFSVPLARRVVVSWVAVNFVAFFSLSMWSLYVLIALVCWVGAPRAPEDRVIYFIGILPALPKFEFVIPGFAGIEILFSVDYARVLAMVVLLPMAARTLTMTSLVPRSRTAGSIDFFVFSYLLWTVALAFDRNGLTHGLRMLFQQMVFLGLPYFVVSRYLTEGGRLKEALRTLLYSALIVASIGIFEQWTNWWFYRNIPDRLGLELEWFSLAHYERDGFVRIRSTIGGGLGLLMAISIGILLVLRQEIRSRLFFFCALTSLALCLYFTGARGSWLAAALAIGLLVTRWFIKSPRHFLAACGLAAILLPVGQRVVEEFDDEYGTFSYRQQLIESAIPMILDRPVAGYNGMAEVEATGRLEHLRQGEGIIDLVNTYLYVAMLEGMLGLALFLGSLLLALFAMLRATARQIIVERDTVPEQSLMLSAIIISMAFLMGTTSMTGYFLDYYMLMLGFSSALVAPVAPAHSTFQ